MRSPAPPVLLTLFHHIRHSICATGGAVCIKLSQQVAPRGEFPLFTQLPRKVFFGIYIDNGVKSEKHAIFTTQSANRS